MLDSRPTACGAAKPLWAQQRRAATTIFLVAFLLRIVLFLLAGGDASKWSGEVEKVARSVVATGTFADPYKIPTGPTAGLAPAYPFFVAAIYLVFGNGYLGGLVTALLGMIACSVQWALLPVVTPVLGLNWRIGRLAGFCGALLPFRMIIEIGGGWDVPYTAVALIGMYVLAARELRHRSGTLLSAAVLGGLSGIALLMSPSVFPVLVSFALFGIVTAAPQMRWMQLRWWGCTLIISGVVILPWVARNYVQFHSFVFIRDNFGIDFAQSNNSQSSANWIEHYGHSPHPSTHLDQALLVKRMGELAYNRLRLADSLQWVRSEPFRFLSLTARRILYFWFPPHQNILRVLGFSVITMLALPGLWLLYRQNRLMAWPFILTWLTFPIVYYFVQYTTRYRYPMDWTIILLASLSMYFFWHRYHLDRKWLTRND